MKSTPEKETLMPNWENEHAQDCQVTRDRKSLVEALLRDPSSEYLLGVVPEYDKGGDQEVENCTCGRV